MSERFCIAVIGAGPGGYYAAIRAAQLGLKVCVIERAEVGGVCLNRGCIPSKAALNEASFLQSMKEKFEGGVDASPNERWARICESAMRAIPALRRGIEGLFDLHKISIYRGEATAESGNRLVVNSPDGMYVIEADNIIIATGSAPAGVRELSADDSRIITSDDVWALKMPPETITIVGAGAAGCEFATLFRAVCREVHLVEMMPEVLPFLDKEISSLVERGLKKKGIKIHKSARVKGADSGDEKIKLILENGGIIETDKVLFAAGREKNVSIAKVLGIELDKNGGIRTDGHMQTSIRSVYAIGDCVGKMMLAHVASQEGIVAAEYIAGRNAGIDYSAVPCTVFTSPEVGLVGLTEKQAGEQGIEVQTSRVQLRSIGRPHADDFITGEVKLVVERDSGEIIGSQIVSKNAAEIIHVLALAIKERLHYRKLAEFVFAHPTYSEIIREAAEALDGMAIHGKKQ